MRNQSRRSLRTVMASLASNVILGTLLLHAADAPVTVNWQTLKTLTSAAPTKPTPALALQNKQVSIPGFMVPLEDDENEVTEFLLVPYAGACIHTPPPPPNQMIYVKMGHNSKVKMSFVDPIVVTGQLKISTIVSPYGDVSYTLNGENVKPYGGQ
jgi:uncharacterized protein